MKIFASVERESNGAWLFAGCLHEAGWKGVRAWVERECLLLLLWIPTHNPLPASREPASDCNSRKHYHDHWDSHLRNLGQKKSFPSPRGSTFWQESSQNLKATCAESSTVLSKFLQWLTTDSLKNTVLFSCLFFFLQFQIPVIGSYYTLFCKNISLFLM